MKSIADGSDPASSKNLSAAARVAPSGRKLRTNKNRRRDGLIQSLAARASPSAPRRPPALLLRRILAFGVHAAFRHASPPSMSPADPNRRRLLHKHGRQFKSAAAFSRQTVASGGRASPHRPGSRNKCFVAYISARRPPTTRTSRSMAA